jgi:hypothetical protein
MMNRHMDEIIREQPTGGRVIGIKASYTPRYDPETGERLERFWQNGNIDEKSDTVYIRARKGVIVGTGGYFGNVAFRTMFDPRLTDGSFQYGNGLMGPLHEDGSGIIAGMKVGAGLAGLMQGYQARLGSPLFRSTLGTQAALESVFPGHPAFNFIRSKGVEIGGGGWEHLIAVNQVGQRFYNESAFTGIAQPAKYPPGSAGTNDPFTPLDWRNTSVEHLKAAIARTSVPMRRWR